LPQRLSRCVVRELVLQTDWLRFRNRHAPFSKVALIVWGSRSVSGPCDEFHGCLAAMVSVASKREFLHCKACPASLR
jgi:hypothetical protein